MKWSQHRKRIRESICPELKKRIDFHVTCYRDAHDGVGEAWITVDRKKVLGAGFYKWWKAFRKAQTETQEKSTDSGGCIASMRGSHFETFLPETEQAVLNQEVYETGYFLKATKDYLNMSLEEALQSSNHLIRALAMVDRRLGKRRFGRIKIAPDDPAIVKLFYALRQEVMNKDIQPPHPTD